jgi:two-component system, chemotaxis family, chemotaxis protein CheY
MHLLIVDDSTLIRKVTHLAFPGAQYQLEEAENGYGALAQLSLAQQPFDVIVLDLQMPDMNGVQFLQALRQRALHRDTPVVIASSDGEDPELLREARRLGGAAVVKKPWKPKELAAAVQAAAASRRYPLQPGP